MHDSHVLRILRQPVLHIYADAEEHADGGRRVPREVVIAHLPSHTANTQNGVVEYHGVVLLFRQIEQVEVVGILRFQEGCNHVTVVGLHGHLPRLRIPRESHRYTSIPVEGTTDDARRDIRAVFRSLHDVVSDIGVRLFCD